MTYRSNGTLTVWIYVTLFGCYCRCLLLLENAHKCITFLRYILILTAIWCYNALKKDFPRDWFKHFQLNRLAHFWRLFQSISLSLSTFTVLFSAQQLIQQDKHLIYLFPWLNYFNWFGVIFFSFFSLFIFLRYVSYSFIWMHW